MTTSDTHIFINGTGKTASLLCLALANSGYNIISPALSAPAPEETGKKTEPQNVLALSPDNCALLETLGVWQYISIKSPIKAPIKAMDIYDSRGGYLPLDRQENLALIVSNDALTSAIYKTLKSKTIKSTKTALMQNYNADTKCLLDKDGTTHNIDLLIDCIGDDKIWQYKPLTHDYDAAALVCLVAAKKPHAHRACQIFTPYGPLAFLPLAQDTHYACIWSQDKTRAAALAKCNADIFIQDMNLYSAIASIDITQIIEGSVCTTYPLHLRLAQNHYAPRAVLVGEAAHRIHPLAGQGFNIALRDIAALMEVLNETRRLGLEIGNAAMCEAYQNRRRPAAAGFAFLTHNLNGIFGTKIAAPLASMGLSALTDFPDLHKYFFDIASERRGQELRL